MPKVGHEIISSSGKHFKQNTAAQRSTNSIQLQQLSGWQAKKKNLDKIWLSYLSYPQTQNPPTSTSSMLG